MTLVLHVRADVLLPPASPASSPTSSPVPNPISTSMLQSMLAESFRVPWSKNRL